MTATDDEDTAIYEVVANDQEQYSIWQGGREPPLGWSTVGIRAGKAECLGWIEKHWTDMRPKSLRDEMARQ